MGGLLVCIICLLREPFPSVKYLLPVNTRSGTFRESSYIPGIHTPDASTQKLSGVRVLAYMAPVEGSR